MAGLLDIFAFVAVLLRAGMLAFQSLVIGGIVFLAFPARLVLSPGGSCGGSVLMSSRRLIIFSAAALACTQLIFMAANSAILMDTAGVPPGELAGASFFIAGAMDIAAAAAIITLIRFPLQRTMPAMLLLCGAIIGASVSTSHAAARLDDRVLPAIATALHQAATATWIGGLPYLLLALGRCHEPEEARGVSARFSRLALISVGVLAGAGAALGFLYIHSIAGLYGTAYGVMVLAKIVLFGELLAFGVLNYRIARRAAAAKGNGPVFRLRRFAEAEVGIGFAVILVAASLTSQPPAVDLVADRVPFHVIAERFTPYWPRLSSPPLRDITSYKQQHSPAAGVTGATPDSYAPGGASSGLSKPADIAWSEYNHHWAGIVVLTMAALMLLHRTGYAPWARHWPLFFLGLAAFLFLRADAENWPLGDKGFLAGFADPEVMQHRVFVVLIAIFAVFEWGVRTGRIESKRAALVFPAICAAGGGMLFAHSHALKNIQEELLAELSHAPLGILGLTAGWARWLELRSPSAKDRRIASWIWPICFLGVGAILLMYREA